MSRALQMMRPITSPFTILTLLTFEACTEPNPSGLGPCDTGRCPDAELTTTTADAGDAASAGDISGGTTTPGVESGTSTTGTRPSSDEGPDAPTATGDDGNDDGPDDPVPFCGDGQLDDGEICDHGADNGAYGHCAEDCSALGPHCGDSQVDDGEVCDDGTDNGSYGHCAEDCSAVASACGDGQLDPANETCDDGNSRSNDGCDRDCRPSAVTNIESGYSFNCVLLRLGDVKCWGAGASGQLGRGGTSNFGDDPGETPASLETLELGGAVAELALDGGFACARLDDGRVKCWGSGGQGQLGYGDLEDVGTTARPLSSVGFVNVDSRGRPAIQIATGIHHACALLEGGAVRCWGGNNAGQLGRGDSSTVATMTPSASQDILPGVVAVGLAAGGNASCIQTQTEGLRCWGQNTYGQLGNGRAGVDEHVGDMGGEMALLGDIRLSASTAMSVTRVDLMGYHACASYGATVRCWGNGGNGRLGNPVANGVDAQSQPVIATVLADTGVGTIRQVSVGRFHSCALDTAGQLACWGRNHAGQLGTGDDTELGVTDSDRAYPIIVDPDATVEDVSAGLAHTCALLSNGAVRCWGSSDEGQLGQGSIMERATPSQVPNIQMF